MRASYIGRWAWPRQVVASGVPKSGPQHAESPRFVPAAGGTWEVVTAAPAGGLCNPLLLTDGTVMAHDCNAPDWWRLTPDINGDYASGVWFLNTSGTVAKKTNIGTAPPKTTAIVGTGDFNADHVSDIVVYNTSGDVGIWFMNTSGTVASKKNVSSKPTSWTVVQ